MVAMLFLYGVTFCFACTSQNSTSTKRLGAGVPRAALSVPNWYIDPQNASGCASDFNNGTSATCASGSGPLSHYYELVSRWGTTSPTLTSAMTRIFWVSGQSDNSDPIDATPYSNTGAADSGVIFQGLAFEPVSLGSAAAPLLGTCTLTGVTVKNRVARTLTTATAACVPDINKLVVNTTHPSAAWSYTALGANTWNFSQPLTFSTDSLIGRDEVDTWATGDTISVYEPVHLSMRNLGAYGFIDIAVYHVKVFSPILNGSIGRLNTGPGLVYFAESRISVETMVGPAEGPGQLELDNVDCLESAPHSQLDRGRIWTSNTDIGVSTSGVLVFGGIIQRESTAAGYFYYDVILDFAHAGGWSLLSGAFGHVYLDSGALLINRSSTIANEPYGNIAPNAIVWGSGSITVSANAELNYVSSTSTATPAQDMLNLSGGFSGLFIGTHCDVPGCAPSTRIDAHPCSLDVRGGTGATRCGTALTPPMLDLPFADGGLGGFAFLPGDGAFVAGHALQ